MERIKRFKAVGLYCATAFFLVLLSQNQTKKRDSRNFKMPFFFTDIGDASQPFSQEVPSLHAIFDIRRGLINTDAVNFSGAERQKYHTGNISGRPDKRLWTACFEWKQNPFA